MVDFTFRVPRGTLLIQVLDELETTLKIQPRVIATVNHNGEIIIIENHYSTVDYLMQKHGTEFFAGGSSVVTFNHGEYIIDLDVPEAIPFASTFRTACKSFSIMPRNVSIERQNGQVMDFEVFRMPTAFVLNSWGNFYRIVDRELGDPLIDPPKADEEITSQVVSTMEPTVRSEEDSMVYPPKLDDSELIGIGNELIEATSEESELDAMTEHYVDSSFPEEDSQEPVADTSEGEDEETEPQDDQTIESLMNEVRLDGEPVFESTTEEEEFLTKPFTESTEDTIITDVSEPTEDLTETPLSEVIDFGDEIDSLEDSISEDEPELEEEDDLVIFAQDYEDEDSLVEEDEEGQEEQIFEEYIDDDTEEELVDDTPEDSQPSFEDMLTTPTPVQDEEELEIEDEELDLDGEEELELEVDEEEQESIPVFAISDLPDTDESVEDSDAATQPFDEDRFIESIRDHYVKDDEEVVVTESAIEAVSYTHLRAHET